MGKVRTREQIANLKVRSSVHLNENQLCSFWMKTSGPDPLIHDIIEFALIPLTSDYQPSTLIHPLTFKIKPLRSIKLPNEKVKPDRETMLDCMKRGLDPTHAAELFEEWFDSIGLKRLKSLVLLTYNFPPKRQFLVNWLGPTNYDHFFQINVRDVLTTAMYIDDVSDMRAEWIPFPKFGLNSFARRLGCEHRPGRKDDSLIWAMTIAEVYRQMVMQPR